ncbi:kinase-like domain-containing protein [Scleroderma yunnanense]
MLQVTTKIEQIMACNRTRDDGITMTSSLALEEFSMLASSYGLDLGAQIKRDESLSNPDLTTFTFRGKLRHSGERGTTALQSSLRSPKETMVVVKAIRDGPPLYRVLAKVDMLLLSLLRLTTNQHMVDGVYALTTLRHENILPLLGLTTNFDGKVSLMSEWIERGDAHEYVQNGDVDPGPLLLGVANGLQYLHNHAPHPILHGALKGSNILISSDRQPLLTDFGLFDLIDPPLVNRLGTINWTSPECLLNPKGSAAGDVWAFAMTTLMGGGKYVYCAGQRILLCVLRSTRSSE